MNSNHSIDSSLLKPQLLFSIPSNLSIKPNILNNQILFSFPNGIDFSSYEEAPKIYPIVLTNEKGNHSYLYILLFYDKISELPDNKNNITRTSNLIGTEIQYCPISIIISSQYSNIDFFKELLKAFYKIIRFDSSLITNYCEKNNMKNNGNTIDMKKIKLFQKLELLNYLNFCYEILRPPNKSILTLNMRFDKIKYKFQSLTEIPTSDYCMDVLFNSLEISVIIKLYIALLFEKNIIIIANQNMPLFCICESIQKLLFPFRWLHPYVPNLPYDQIGYLDSPIPYLIGINSSRTSAPDLNASFPSHIICEVGTSTLYGNISNLKLPINEEMKIKTKLLLLKSKYKNNYDEFDGEGGSSNGSGRTTKISTDEFEDVDFKLSFAQNVQNIFFRIFKNNLMNIKKEYITNNVFNSQKFLNSFDDEEYKLFFEKIINTVAFEFFLSSMKFLDNSLSRQFNLIYKYADKKLKGKIKEIKYFNYSFFLRKKLKFDKLNEKDTYISSIFESYNEISTFLDENSNKFFRNSESNNSIYSKSKSSSDKNIKYSSLNFYGKDGFISFLQNYRNIIDYRTKFFDEIFNLYNETNSLKLNLEDNSNQDNKMDNIECPLLINMNKYIHNNIKNENNKINEDEINKTNNNESEKIIDIPKQNCYQLYIILALYLYYYLIKNNSEKKNGNYTVYKNNNDSMDKNQLLSKTKDNQPKKRKSISNVSLLNLNYKGTEINNKIIFNLFIDAFRKNQEEFPRNLFFSTLNIFSLDDLQSIGVTNLKYIDKTVQCQIRKIQKISYKTMVINNDSDNDEIIPKEKEKNLTLKKLNSGELEQIQNKLNIRKSMDRRKTSKLKNINYKLFKNFYNNSQEMEKEEEEEDEEEEENKDNFTKTKLNVIENGYKDNSQNNKGTNNQQSSLKMNFNNLRKIYKYQKRNNELKSWNNINFSNKSHLSNNSNNSVNELSLDPMEISEKICTELYSFLISVKIENFNEKNCDINYLKDIAHSDTFEELKELILSLKNISIENLALVPKNYYCFWLNIYNFLTIFAVIYKCEIISNSYEWYRFLKNSYFTIGNIEISLYEIESKILRDKEISDKIYGYASGNEQLKFPNINKFNSIINFGISLPTTSAPSIRMYFPMNFSESLKLNASLFFSNNLKIDIQNNTIEIPEYVTFIDSNFINNMEKYSDNLPHGFLNFIKKNPSFKITVGKYDWKLSYANFKNSEINNSS